MALTVTNPFDRTVVAELAGHDDNQAREAVARAHEAHRAWRRVPLDDRIAAVRRALEQFDRDREAIAREITLQMGKPIREARGEVATMLSRAETLLDLARDALAPELLPERLGFVRRIEHEPLGVVLAIAAWNYPLLIPINVIVPALVAGNAVLLKHSPLTPLSGQRFTAAFARLATPGTGGAGSDGVWADLVQDLVIEHDQVATLITDPRIAHVAFTGSVQGGSAVYRTVASSRLIDVGLELGGKDPAYVAADADLEHAAAGVVEGACYNAGQSCCAIERVYIHHAVYDEMLDRMRAALGELVMGDPLAETTTLGPQARASNLAVLAEQVKGAVAGGASLLCGGEIEGAFFQPTLLAGAVQASPVMQEESFGPLVPVARVDDDDQALALMADTRFGLTAAVWTRDQQRAERFARELDVGTVFQNRCDYLDPEQPWTGVGDSGKGSTLSRHGFWHLTRRKSIHLRVVT